MHAKSHKLSHTYCCTNTPTRVNTAWKVSQCTWEKAVLIHIPTKTGLRLRPSKTLRWPWILRALTSLNSVIRTNVLNMIVKCCEVVVRRAESSLRPLSMSNAMSPACHTHQLHQVRRFTSRRCSPISSTLLPPGVTLQPHQIKVVLKYTYDARFGSTCIKTLTPVRHSLLRTPMTLCSKTF